MSRATIVVAVSGTYAEDQIEKAVADQMAPFDENGTWFKDGSRWDWFVIGGRWENRLNGKNVIRKRDLHIEDAVAQARKRAIEWWEEAQAEKDEQRRAFMFDIEPSTTREQHIKSLEYPIMARAFLRDLEWHDGERMGWFGCSAKTESNADGGIHVCISTHKRLRKAKVVTHNEDRETWRAAYWDRFIAPLPDDEWLVMVDYHV